MEVVEVVSLKKGTVRDIDLVRARSTTLEREESLGVTDK